ncbi:hypothetical protein O6H91_08G022100 [Diphasiastrum complanatum]|uniref:Uncharacterized protein n=1 Tax=Diphasiastrum complanatum TaxID=34168 RepID=A0ACC2CVM5_DIPCM|nr:hypothetical protein O6H91_08G022100 [Diphasiastrum complanatum]
MANVAACAVQQPMVSSHIRFHPSDEKLVAYYLHRKVNGLIFEFECITQIELYK